MKKICKGYFAAYFSVESEIVAEEKENRIENHSFFKLCTRSKNTFYH